MVGLIVNIYPFWQNLTLYCRLNVGIFVLRVFLEFTPEYRTILGVAAANIVYFTGEVHSGITGPAFGVAIAGVRPQCPILTPI